MYHCRLYQAPGCCNATRKMTWKPNVTVAAIIESAGRYLLVQERDRERVVLNQPAGHLEPHESLMDAVVRETLEETGRHFQPQALVGIYRFDNTDNGITYLRVCFCGNASAPEPGRALDADIIDTVWLAPEAVERRHRELRSPLVQHCIRDYQSGRRYPLDLLVDLSSQT